MSYETAARRANGTTTSARLEEAYEDRYQSASDAIHDQALADLKGDQDTLADLLAACQEIGLEQPEGPNNLLTLFPWLRLDMHRGKSRLRAVQAQLAYAARDMEPDEFFVNCACQESEC